jgi:hypothetical protein
LQKLNSNVSLTLPSARIISYPKIHLQDDFFKTRQLPEYKVKKMSLTKFDTQPYRRANRNSCESRY